jgi:rare lipoprotein A
MTRRSVALRRQRFIMLRGDRNTRLERGLAGAVLLATLGFAVSCRSAPTDRVRIGWSQRGEASWYGMPFHGRRTASGERYDMYRMSAAHRELPFGTVVEVHNVENGRRIQVRVNDRGPFVRGRVLDLSYAAATELDMVRTGTAAIELRVVELGQMPLPASAILTVQVGAFQTRSRAETLASELADDFPEVRVEESLPWFRVRIGTFADAGEAEEVRQRLRRRGYHSVVTRAGMGPRLSDET